MRLSMRLKNMVKFIEKHAGGPTVRKRRRTVCKYTFYWMCFVRKATSNKSRRMNSVIASSGESSFTNKNVLDVLRMCDKETRSLPDDWALSVATTHQTCRSKHSNLSEKSCRFTRSMLRALSANGRGHIEPKDVFSCFLSYFFCQKRRKICSFHFNRFSDGGSVCEKNTTASPETLKQFSF